MLHPMKSFPFELKSIILILISVISLSVFGLFVYSSSSAFALLSPLVSLSIQGPLSNSLMDQVNSTGGEVLSVETLSLPSSPSEQITIGGTITSKDDPAQGTGLEQSYYIFPVENNSKTYSGVITFTSSKPVQLQSINTLTLNNTIKLPIQFGTLYTFPLNNTIIITSDLFDVPKVTGTVSFSGNSLRFITNEPFLLTYSFSGQQSKSVVENDIESGLDTYRKLIGPIS